ncbi:WD repeat-containing protein 86 isoform X6 [Hylobates moloch]|uniref:WD repeat-containing protein 86 isoform X6 n=1 Tax=Hylobates moloch TaxID=81572 RepID=UPI002675E37E|nr:WD repeat-containing protein 86 isoform X6 [Hylobates moloch]
MSREFRGHRNCVLTLAYSAPWDLPSTPCVEEAAAGGLLVTGSTDGTAKVWQVASGCCHQTLRGHTGAVLCLVLDTPGHTAFTGSTDATIRAWDILSGEQLRVFREHQGSVICLEWWQGPLWGMKPAPVSCAIAPDHCSCGACLPALAFSSVTLLTRAGEPIRVLWQRGQDRQVLAGRHRGVCAHVHGPQTQRERPQVPRGHLVHGQRGRLRPGLRRAVWRAAEGVPGPHIHHQLHPGARPGALHRLPRRRPAPLGRARAPRCPAAPSAHAQPLAPLQQQGGLRHRAPAAGLIPRGPCRRQPRRPAAPRAPRPATRGGGARWPGRSEEARAGGEPGAGVWFFFGGQQALGAGVLTLGTAPFSLLGWLLFSLPIPDLAKGLVPGTLPPQGLQADCPSSPSPTNLGLSC